MLSKKKKKTKPNYPKARLPAPITKIFHKEIDPWSLGRVRDEFSGLQAS